MALQHTLERHTVRTLMKLPGSALGRLAGLVEKVDRGRLDPRLRLLLALGDGRKGFHQLPLPKGRAFYAQMIDMLDVGHEAVAQVSDLCVPVVGGDILVRLYRPVAAPIPGPGHRLFPRRRFYHRFRRGIRPPVPLSGQPYRRGNSQCGLPVGTGACGAHRRG